MSTAQDLPGLYGEPLAEPVAPPALRLVNTPELDFDQAVRQVRPRLHRYAIRRLGDAHEAEELVQEALLRAYTHRDQLLTEEDLSAWSTVVTGRLVIDRLRVRGRSTSVAEVPEGSRVGRDTAEVVVARDEARTALDALDAMPARQASLLWAREVEGKSYDELCEQFDMTEPAVRSVLTRARKALRREYELRGGTVPVGGLAILAPWIAGLTWADKLRKCANKITAPAVLGAAGIAALGGLVLSPFGADKAPSTFTPAQAVVASSVDKAAVSSAHSVSGTKVIKIARQGGSSAGSTSTRNPHDEGLNPLKGFNRIPCTETRGTSTPRTLPGGRPVPIGVSYRGSQCQSKGGEYQVGPDLPAPVTKVTGYQNVTVSSTNLPCGTLPTVATQTQILKCSETQK